ncbi:MAG: Uma2 family endonuclease, partial [Chloroflexota bacterium]
RRFELIDGEIIEMAPGRTINSAYGDILVFRVHLFCYERSIPCYTTSGDGDYDIQGHIVAPDFSFKPTPMSDIYPDPEPPLWAVEIISPTDKGTNIRNKRKIYLEAGILYWEIYPQKQSIDVYEAEKPVRTVDINGTVDVGDILPGFTFTVRHLFAE